MSKITLLISSLIGTLSVFIDLPIFFVFGGVFIVIMIELKKIERKPIPILRNLYGSVMVGWGSSFGVKHFFPTLMEGDVRIFSMLVTTLFSYGVVIYLFRNETIGKFVAKYLTKKVEQ